MAVIYRRATQKDLAAIIALLADDPIGSTRETSSLDVPQTYRDTFTEIAADPKQFLCVVERDAEIIGTCQLSFIPGFSRNGAKRGQIEAVRVARHCRGENVGGAMLTWAVEQCRSRGCKLVQLTTDKTRLDAHEFYLRLGFEPTHISFKLIL